MRRREKFVIAAVLLSIGLLGVQYIPLEMRYLAVSVFVILTYLVSAWALADDLQRHELITIVPLPALYSASVGLFYFLLPANWVSRILLLIVFGVGMYALYLTSNIYSVAKSRSIQLLHAAHTIALYFTVIMSLFFLNTLFSLKLPFWANGALVFLSHFALSLLSLWSIKLEERISREVVAMSMMLSAVLAELAIAFSFMPLNVWHISLFLMSVLYIGLGIGHNFLRGRLFGNTLTEYSMVGGFVLLVFILLFPGK